jgi:DegV family protein with EDD domain
MRIGVIVDSMCDMPSEIYRQYGITILPVTVRIGETRWPDYRDEKATLAFLNSDIAKRAAEAETTAFSVKEFHDLFLERLVIDYDYVFCLTLARTRSLTYDNAMQASFSILNDYKAPRNAAGHHTPFALRVIDTTNLFSAQAILPLEALRLIDAGSSTQKIRARLDYLAPMTHGYMVPRDLYYIRARARAKGEKSVGLATVVLGSALDIKPIIHCNRCETHPVAKAKGFDAAVKRLFAFAADRVRAGLLTPDLALSYGGALDELRALPGYGELRKVCLERDVQLHESLMSMTGMVNAGKGAVVVGFASEPHAFDA